MAGAREQMTGPIDMVEPAAQTVLGTMGEEWRKQMQVMMAAGYEFDRGAHVWKRPNAPEGLQVVDMWTSLEEQIKKLQKKGNSTIGSDFNIQEYMGGGSGGEMGMNMTPKYLPPGVGADMQAKSGAVTLMGQ